MVDSSSVRPPHLLQNLLDEHSDRRVRQDDTLHHDAVAGEEGGEVGRELPRYAAIGWRGGGRDCRVLEKAGEADSAVASAAAAVLGAGRGVDTRYEAGDDVGPGLRNEGNVRVREEEEEDLHVGREGRNGVGESGKGGGNGGRGRHVAKEAGARRGRKGRRYERRDQAREEWRNVGGAQVVPK